MIQKTTWFQLRPLYQFLRQQADNKKFLKYLEVGATFILVALFLFLAIKPTAQAISTLVGEIKSKELNIKNMKSKIQNVLLAQESFAQVQERYPILDSSYPSQEKFYQVASNFSSISKQSSIVSPQIGFNLNQNPDKKSDSATGKSYEVKLNGSGSFSSIMDVIEKITNSRRLVDVKSIQIVKNDFKTGSASGEINFNVSSDLFYLPSSQ